LYSNGYGIYESRLRKFIKPSLTSPAVNLLHVMLLAAGDHPTLLGLVKDGLARLLHERGITDMFVEMGNIDPCFQPSLFPMSPDHGLVVSFEEGMQRIIGLIQATSGNNWRLLCPNVGRVETEARPAIVILVDYLTRANWCVLDTDIKASLARHCQFQTVEVDFLPEDLRFLNGTFSAHLRAGPVVTTRYALVKASTCRDVFLDMADISLLLDWEKGERSLMSFGALSNMANQIPPVPGTFPCLSSRPGTISA
jgi:hypothetical protein